ncbi:MAG: SSI family serine proteinase inhibitor [Gaiellaceae bacterium]
MVLLAALAASTALASSPANELRITVWPDGRAKASHRWTLRCGPSGGTLPGARLACASLARRANPFRPIASDAVCTELYGGPQEALVTGRYRGRRIWTRFARTDGCQIERWNRLRFLFPSG